MMIDKLQYKEGLWGRLTTLKDRANCLCTIDKFLKLVVAIKLFMINSQLPSIT